MKKVRDFLNAHELIKLLVIFLLCGLVLYLRRPDALANPQFWAEDGKHWYADAFNMGAFTSLFEIYAGSLQIAMRIIGSFSLLIPLSLAPLFFTVVALAIKITPVLILFSKRFQNVIPNLTAKVVIAIFYILIPTGSEVHANLTNINWHLVIIAFMILIASQPKTVIGRYFDYSITLIAGLTGPFSIFLSVIAGLQYKNNRSKHSLVLFIVLATCGFIQFLILTFSTEESRSSNELGLNVLTLIEIIGFRIGGTAIFGQDTIAAIFRPPSGTYVILGLVTIFVVYISYKFANNSLRLFILFTLLLLGATLYKPIASDSMPQWYALLVGAGSRYFFIPIICFFLCLLNLIAINSRSKRNSILRTTSYVLIATSFLIAIPSSFIYEPRADLHFQKYVSDFNSLPDKNVYCIPIPPTWEMCLFK
jgi:hypothetical protein